MTATPWGLYLHVPSCRIRCPYCAFYVLPDTAVDGDRLVDRLIEEVRRRSSPFDGDPRTVYVGGGTPSRLPAAALRRLLQAVAPAACAEVTVEANPEDVDADWLDAVVGGGATRVSLGVQTLDPVRAARLARLAGARAAATAAALLRSSGLRSWSADLMFALPGQDEAGLDADLDALLALGPPHVSVYGLTIEPGTPFERAAARPGWKTADEEVFRAMYARVVQRLGDAGLERYEVSNFARPGHRSLHNEGYWTDLPYLGVGPSAHGYLPDGRRTVDTPDLSRWLDGDVVDSVEEPDDGARAADLLIAGLRGVAGVSLSDLAARTGLSPEEAVVERLVRGGLLRREGERMMLDAEGFFVSDAVTRRLVEALRPVGQGLAAGPAIR